ncbi:uncharacterized protein LOC144434420 [Glandiceps talaboti]
MASPMADVYVKLTTGRVISFDMLPSKTVEEIYQKVAEEEGVSNNRIVIRYTGKVVKRQCTIGYLGICKETILKSQVLTVRSMEILIKTEKGPTIPLAVNNLTTLSEVKDRIQAQEGIAPHKQMLQLSGTTLKPDLETLGNLEVTNEAVLKLTVKEEVENNTEPENDQLDEETRQELLDNFAAGLTSDKAVEVVFSFDTTGSMYSCLQQVRDKIRGCVTKLLQDIPRIRIGIIAHGDYCDHSSEYVLRSIDLTYNVNELVRFASNVPKTGGGDAPECYEWVLRYAQRLNWSEDSAKALVVIGDDVPHPKSMTDQMIDWHEELVKLKDMGVKVYGVKAQHNSSSTPFYQEIAEQTGGAYIQFKHFSLITDMFLAVCYKESGNEQLQAYCEVVKTEGRMTEDMAEIFQQLEEKPKMEEEEEEEEKQEAEKASRYVKQAWWDPSLDNGHTQYSYNADKDKWSAFFVSRIGTDHKKESTETKRTFSLRKSKKMKAYSSVPLKQNKKSCVIQ